MLVSYFQMFYVDRVVHYKRHVKRVFPLINGWTSDALRIRQRSEINKGGFGRGYVDERFDPTENFRTEWDNISIEKGEPCNNDEEILSTKEDLSEVDEYTKKLISNAKKVADSMSALMNVIMEAPMKLRQNTTFSKTVHTSAVLIGVKTTIAADKPSQDCSESMLDEEYQTQEWKETLVRMMEVFEEKQKLEECLGHPSFSLGLDLSEDPLFDSEMNTQVGEVNNH